MPVPPERTPNPYQPPGRYFSPKPLRQRLRIATRRAVAEYRAGMRRDGIGVWEHLRLLFSLVIIVAFFALMVFVFVGDALGWL